MAAPPPSAVRGARELLAGAASLGVELPFSEDVSPLLQPLRLGERTLRNRLAVHPMEGFDGEPDGSPGELTLRRCRRFAEGGSALVWLEATAVVPEGRSNPRQLVLHEGNAPAFARLVAMVRERAAAAFPGAQPPFLVLQLTHSGRLARPDGRPAPLAAAPDPPGEGAPGVRVATDDELLRLRDRFVEVAALAARAGLDAVDVKACHGYLVHELLSARRRVGRFGGEEVSGRARFLLEVVEGIRATVPGLRVAVRLGVFDGVPDGFGTARDGSATEDLAEPLALARDLCERGCLLLNVTAGVPARNPHVGRPFDRPLPGAGAPPEHPLAGVARLIRLAAAVQRRVPEAAVVGTGYSWLRWMFPHVAAAVVARGDAALVGLGRSSFAYPDAPRDLAERGRLDPEKACVACSRCTELMRRGGPTGCAVRDREAYRVGDEGPA